MKLSRRKYSLLVKFLRDTLANPSISLRVRMQAASRLDAILERNEKQQEQAAMRYERTAGRAALVAPDPAQPDQADAIAPTEAPSEPAPDDDLKAIYAELFPAGKNS